MTPSFRLVLLLLGVITLALVGWADWFGWLLVVAAFIPVPKG